MSRTHVVPRPVPLLASIRLCPQPSSVVSDLCPLLSGSEADLLHPLLASGRHSSFYVIFCFPHLKVLFLVAASSVSGGCVVDCSLVSGSA